ncbi:hypothetical protein JI750_16145 [Flavobacterium sp. GN10]|uniref:GLPGLI family protein n=1 Tax=Flavobacterium tagetis TaxID=2801336 RepID=A0ABS1KGG5_9FLAO|nr:hypothetical protein [Flavobacterium tagetis]MBL0738428.1 hypothetical protein [Flavobacterium tagetis]
MTNLNFKILLIIFSISFSCFGQGKGMKITINSKQLDSKYELYKPAKQIRIVYKDTSDAKNKTTDELMTSIISANNQDWVNYNTFGGKEKAAIFSEDEFNKKVKLKEKYYLELLSKLELKVDSINYTIVKFKYFQNNPDKPIMGVTLMIHKNERWYQTFNAEINNLSMMMLVFKEDILGRMIKGAGNNQMENDLIKIIYKDGLNVDFLFKQNLNSEQKKYFINDLNW